MKNSAASESIETTNPRIMPAEPEWVRAETLSALDIPKNGVDRENAVIRGYVVAQEGPHKDAEGDFDQLSLQQMADIINAKPNGIKSRFTHPSISGDGLGKFLGRSKNARVEPATVVSEWDDKTSSVLVLRADLHFDKTALDTPPNGGKPLGEYVMALCESDPAALSSSVVIPLKGLKKEYRINEDGTRKKDESGKPLPPLWRLSKLYASDIVDTGAAVEGLLSLDLPDSAVRQGCDILDRVFGGQPADVTKSRALAWLNRYIKLRYPGEALIGDDVEALKAEIESLTADKNHLAGVCEELQSRLNKANEENAKLHAENMRLEVDRVFDDELEGYVKSGERAKYLPAALKMRERGNGPESEFRIFIESLKARDKNEMDTEPIAEGAGHSLTIGVTPADQHEEKREVSGFLMP